MFDLIMLLDLRDIHILHTSCETAIIEIFYLFTIGK